MKFFYLVLQITVLFSLAGCEKTVELQRNLAEADANEVIAELAEKQVKAEKRVDKNGVTILVKQSDMARSVRILNAAGLPRTTQATFGEVFQKEGMISTPMEERARYLYALSQEIEHTLSLIDGVIKARVHVVLPEKVAPGEPTLPSSAAVFIKHIDSLDPDIILPRIKKMVASSIPGLPVKNSNKLAVVFVPAKSYQAPPQPDAPPLPLLTIILILIGVFVVGGLVVAVVLTQTPLKNKLLASKTKSTELKVSDDP